MKDAGYAHMGVGHAAGKGKAEEAARAAVSSPLMETSINGARGVLVNITGSMDIGLDDVEAAASLVQEAAHPDANIIFGATFDETMDDEMRVTVIATRFDEKPTNSYKNPDRRAVDPASLFSGEKKAAEPAPQTQPAPEPAREPAKPAQDEEDPFIDIFKIFNS